MAKNNRPIGFVSYSSVLEVIERSIDSTTNFAELTNNAFGDPEETVSRLHALQDLVIELSWRYFRNVMFRFTQKHSIEGALPLADVIGHTEEYEAWENRVFINETTDGGFCKVYIRF